MNRNIIEGRWKELKAQMKNHWGKLTDDDWTRAEGKVDELVAALQRRYGYEKEEAAKRVEQFADSIKAKVDGAARARQN